MSDYSAALVASDRPQPATAGERNAIFGRLAIVLGLVAYVAALIAAWWALENFLPDRLHVTLLGHGLTLREVHRRIVSDGLIFLLLPTVLMLEWLAVGWAGSSARQLLFARKASNKTDLAIFLMGQGHLTDLAGRVLTLGASMLTGAWIHDRLSTALGFPLTLVPASMPMAILGASPAAMIYVNVLVITLGFVIHSRIDSNFGWIGRWIIQSPNHHRLHHVLDISEQPTGHFAMAPVWDHLFGTWRGEADQTLVIGVDTAYRQGFWIVPDLARDYWHFWKGWFQRAA